MEPQDKNQNFQWTPAKKFFSETILVALLTGTGYLAAFAYQYSYLKYFNIPAFFIDINIGLILLTTLVGLICLIILSIVLNFFAGWKPDRKISKVTRKASIFILLSVVMFFPIITSNNPNDAWEIILICFGVLVALIFLIIGSYRNPEIPDKGIFDKTGEKKNEDGLLFKAEQIYGSFPILFITILLLFIFYSGAMGTIIAKNKSEYLVSNTNPKLIIISTYSDSFIGLTFNPNTLKFNKDIILLGKDKVSENDIIFTIEKIGRLTSN